MKEISKKLETLNDEHFAKIDTVKKFWLDYIFSCKNQVNKEAANIGIGWLYKLAGRDQYT